MAEDPPGGWELKRSMDIMREDIKDGFAQLNSRFDQVTRDSVGVREYNADKKRLEDRHFELRKDFEEFQVYVGTKFTETRKDAKQSKQWATSTAIAGSVMILALASLIFRFAGI